MSGNIILRFILHFSVYLFIIAGVSAYPLYRLADAVILEGVLANTLLFYFVTIISFWIIIKWSKKSKGAMINTYLGSTFLKMLVSLVYFIALLDNFPGREVAFAVTFFVAYLVCTVFEVYYLLHNLRQI